MTIICSICQSTVVPVKKFKVWVVILWLIFFWPGALIYILTRNADSCPVCKAKVYSTTRVPKPRQSQTASNPTQAVEVATADVPRKPQRRKTFYVVTGIVGVLAVVVIVVVIAAASSEDQSTENKSVSAAEEEEEQRKGFHCLSPWDGNHDGLEALVRDQLKDPSSMETHGTRISPVNSLGRHTVIMDFGARNSFGGMVRQTATGWVDNETCEAELLAIE